MLQLCFLHCQETHDVQHDDGTNAGSKFRAEDSSISDAHGIPGKPVKYVQNSFFKQNSIMYLSVKATELWQIATRVAKSRREGKLKGTI